MSVEVRYPTIESLDGYRMLVRGSIELVERRRCEARRDGARCLNDATCSLANRGPHVFCPGPHRYPGGR